MTLARKILNKVNNSIKISENSGLNWQHPWVLVQDNGGQYTILGTYDDKREANNDMKGMFYNTGPQRVIPMTPEISNYLKKTFG